MTTGNARARLNFGAFYKNEKGLLIGYDRGEFEAMAGGQKRAGADGRIAPPFPLAAHPVRR